MISLVIVSDIRLYREGLEEILEREDILHVKGTAGNVEQAIGEIRKNSPDVVLIDMTMINSNKVVEYIASVYRHMKIIALAVTEDEDVIFSCAKAGIAGYLTRESSIKQLIDTICGVFEGELYCPRRIAARLLKKLKILSHHVETSDCEVIESPANSKNVVLTKREKQIASLLSKGLSNKEIARKLTIEVSTVKNHIHNILTKMDVHNRIQAVRQLQYDTIFD